jgi:hypothetical protein
MKAISEKPLAALTIRDAANWHSDVHAQVIEWLELQLQQLRAYPRTLSRVHNARFSISQCHQKIDAS